MAAAGARRWRGAGGGGAGAGGSSGAVGGRDAPSRGPCISGSRARAEELWFFLSPLEGAPRPPTAPFLGGACPAIAGWLGGGTPIAALARCSGPTGSSPARGGGPARTGVGLGPRRGAGEEFRASRASVPRGRVRRRQAAESAAIRAAAVHLIASRVRPPMRPGQPRGPRRAPLAAALGLNSPLSSAAVLAKPAPEYELVLMLDPEAPDERREEIAVNARRRIEEGATLKQERTWGTRKMSYEIDQRNEADYRFFRFEQGTGRPRRPQPQPQDHRRRASLPDLQGRPARSGDRPAGAAFVHRRLAIAQAAAARGARRRLRGPPAARPRARGAPAADDAAPGTRGDAAPAARHHPLRLLAAEAARRRGPSRGAAPAPLPPRRPLPRRPSAPRRPRPLRPSLSSPPSSAHPAISAFFSSGGARTRRPRP